MSRPRPRLLFLGQTLPFPPDGGVNIRMYHTLRLLARAFDVTALCFVRRRERPSAEAVAAGVRALSPFARVEAFAIPQEHSLLRWTWDHLRSVATGRAYIRYAYDSPAMTERIATLRRTIPFDMAHLDSLDLAGYLPLVGDLPVACAHHNVESQLLARRAELEKLPWRGAYLRHQARLLERWEQEWCRAMTLNVAVSEADAEVIRRRAPGTRVIVVPNGVDASHFAPATPAEPEEGVVGVGGLNWAPNRDALEYLCDQILPYLRRRLPGASVRWVGRATDGQRREYGLRHGVVLTGYVDDVRPSLARAACVVAPLRAGGGTRLKILDAWAMGKAVVSTSVGCEGLDAVDGENILVRDTPEGIAEGVGSVLNDPGLRTRLGAAARRTIERTYDWEVIGGPMTERYLELAGRRAPALAAS